MEHEVFPPKRFVFELRNKTKGYRTLILLHLYFHISCSPLPFSGFARGLGPLFCINICY